MNGKFIVIEGGEGTGKSSCVSFLENYFRDNREIIFTREPGGTEFGEKVREVFISAQSAGKISVLAELLTFCAMRANHCDMLIRPALIEGKTVICDRFYQSTIAYQIFGREQHDMAETFLKINEHSIGLGLDSLIEPSLVIFLDVEPEVGLSRVKSRQTLSPLEKSTRFDEEELLFHNRVREGYLSQFKSQKNWVKIDTTHKTQEEVQKEVLELVKSCAFG